MLGILVYMFIYMLVCISDLDGTLLDDTYSCQEAIPALRELADRQIPLILCSSKTRSEIEQVRLQIANHHPFIVENGGAIYIQEQYFPVPIDTGVRRDGYVVLEFGDPYAEIVECLRQAAAESGCMVRGFHQMSVAEISASCNLSPEAARLAKQREYDEPFEIVGGDPKNLFRAIEDRKKRWTRGGRFFHILGPNDKEHCVILLRRLYEKIYQSVVTVGLGDGINDAGFLNRVDIPFLMDSEHIKALKKMVPHGRLCASGPEGWNAAIHDVIRQYYDVGPPDSNAR